MPYVRTPRGLRWVSSSQAGRPVSPYGSRYPRRPVRRPGADGYYTPPQTEAAGGDGMVTVEGWVPGPGGGLVRGPVTYSAGGGPSDKKKPAAKRDSPRLDVPGGGLVPDVPAGGYAAPTFPAFGDPYNPAIYRSPNGPLNLGYSEDAPRPGRPPSQGYPEVPAWVSELLGPWANTSYIPPFGLPSTADNRSASFPTYRGGPGPDVLYDRSYNKPQPFFHPGPDLFTDPGYGRLRDTPIGGGDGGYGYPSAPAPAPGAEEPWFPYYMRGGGGVNLNFGGGGQQDPLRNGPWNMGLLNWRF